MLEFKRFKPCASDKVAAREAPRIVSVQVVLNLKKKMYDHFYTFSTQK